MRTVTKTVSNVTQSGDIFSMTVSTPATDRDGDSVRAEGMDARAFRRNPCLLWNHQIGGDMLPIGTVHTIDGVAGVGVRSSFSFLRGDPFADRVRNAWDQGVVRAASIGFRPQSSQPNSTGGFDINKWELLEVSLCPIPANPEATRACKALGLFDTRPKAARGNDLLKVDRAELDALIRRTLRDHIAAVVKHEVRQAATRHLPFGYPGDWVIPDLDIIDDPAAARAKRAEHTVDVDPAHVADVVKRATRAVIDAAVAQALKDARGRVG